MPFKVIQSYEFKVMYFMVSVKKTRDYILVYSNVGLISKAFEDIATENTEKLPVSFDASCPPNPREYPHKPYFAGNYSLLNIVPLTI